MSFFGKNIKKIRTVKKLSQSAFADIFELKRGSIGAYEEGRAEAKIDTIISIANYYKLSLDQLLKSELTINEIYHLDSINKKFYHSKSSKKESYISYISIIAKDEFIQNFENLDFLDQLPKISIPFIKQKFIAFECFDSSMLGQFSGIKQGDILISQLIEFNDIIDIPKQSAIIVLYENDLEIGIPEIKTKELILHPVNMNYQKHYINTGKVKKVWLVKKIITDSFIKEKTIEQRIQNLENKLIDLKSKV
ncbi:MAG: helix-turn-helix transcriptional regulator [Bacteroidota bacterium]